MSGLLNWYASPEVQLGMGLLSANNGQKGSLMKGLQTGMNNAAVMQQRQAEEKQKQLKLQQAADQRAWMTQNMPTYADAPPPVQKAAIEQQFRAQRVPTAFDQKLALFNSDPETFAKLYPKASPLVQVGQKLRSLPEQIEYDTRIARSKEAYDTNKQSVAWGSEARANSRRYETMLGLLDSVETGTFADAKLKAAQLAKVLGMDVDIESIANQEQLLTLFGNEVMSVVSQTKGAVSEREMRLFQEFSAGLGKTSQGNRQILQYKLAQSKRDMEIAAMVRNLRRQKQSSVEISHAVFDYVNDPQNDLSKFFAAEAAAPVSQVGSDLSAAAAEELKKRGLQ